MTANDLQQPLGLLLYAHPDDLDSHTVRLVLAEKAVPYTLILVDPDDYPEDLASLNPYNTLPTLIDRQLKLYQPTVILEYLEDRYRQPRLYSDNPIQRAEQRQYLWRIQHDWLSLAQILLRHPDSFDAEQANQARKQLQDSLISLSPLFGMQQWFMQDQFGICDCVLAPILWRLPTLEIHLPPALCAPLLAYCQRIFQRPAFVASLTARERQARRPIL